MIPYQPEPWAWVYLSQFLFTSLLPWFLPTRNEIFRCSAGLVLMSAISFVVFLFFPVAAPPRINGMGHLSMTIIAAYDGSLNCFPSLHAAFLFYMAALGRRLFGSGMHPIAVALCAIWGMAILYATIATRQHYALDLVAGAAVGCVSYWLAWRGSDRAVVTMPCNRVVTSHEGVR
ncbi:MAG: phosphatase PAP2 family protein [Chthoniobacterales bacterium]